MAQTPFSNVSSSQYQLMRNHSIESTLKNNNNTRNAISSGKHTVNRNLALF